MKYSLKLQHVFIKSKLVFFSSTERKMAYNQVQIRVSYSNQIPQGVLITVQTNEEPSYSDALENVMTIVIGSTNVHLTLLTVGTRTAVIVVYTYPLHPTNAFEETRTVIMFPNLPAIGLRPNNFVINMTYFIGLSPYGIEENVAIIINVVLAGQSDVVMLPTVSSNNPVHTIASHINNTYQSIDDDEDGDPHRLIHPDDQSELENDVD